MTVASVAALGFARDAATYAISRPGYPDAIVDWLRDELGIGPASLAIDVGAGTGLFTAMLLRTGARVIAIDPVAAMLTQLRSSLPDVDTIEAAADAIPLPDASVDAIVCATAFHWFAHAAVVAEFGRLLRPGGALGLIWNLRDEREPWVRQLSEITDAWSGEAARQRDGSWRDPFPAPGFSPLVDTTMTYEHRGHVDDVVIGRTLSTSFIAALDRDAQATVLDQVKALIAKTPALGGDEVVFPYVTKAYHCRRID
jgi:SAM-dependent methyltransferase